MGSGHEGYRYQYRRCGKGDCQRCADGPGHGPYWYAIWHKGARVRTRYVGTAVPAGTGGDAGRTEPARRKGMRAPLASSMVGGCLEQQ